MPSQHWLATILLLACVCTSSKALDPKTIVARSSPLQHASDVTQSDVHLMPNSTMTQNIDGVKEERAPHLIDFFRLERDKELNTLNNRFKSEVGKYTRIETNRKLLMDARFQQFAKFIERRYPRNRLEAESFKIDVLLANFHELDVLRMIEYVKKQPVIQDDVKYLELAHMMRWMASGRQDDVIKRAKRGDKIPIHSSESSIVDKNMDDVLQSSLWTAWMKEGTDESKDQLCQLLFKHLKDIKPKKRVELFVKLKSDVGKNELGTKLEELQLDAWQKASRNSEFVFKHLELAEAGENMLANSLWNTFESYVSKLSPQKEESLAVTSFLLNKLGPSGLEAMITRGKSAKTTEKTAESMRHAYLMLLSTHKKRNFQVHDAESANKRVKRDSTRDNRQ